MNAITVQQHQHCAQTLRSLAKTHPHIRAELLAAARNHEQAARRLKKFGGR